MDAARPGDDVDQPETSAAGPVTAPAADLEAGGPPDEPRVDAATDEEDDGSSSVLAFLRELPVLLLIAFALAFLLRTFVVQVFYIPSSSMEPTLQVNDRMIVEKLTYRFRDPRRGEIVVFEGERSFVGNQDQGLVPQMARRAGQFLGIVPANARDFVKRVIGLPGDEVRIDDEGVVYVNGVALDEGYVRPQRIAYGPITVPAGKLFFLGDNRGNSSDSRSGLGFVDRGQVVGRAVLIIWPFDHLETLRQPDYGQIPPGGTVSESLPESRAGPRPAA